MPEYLRAVCDGTLTVRVGVEGDAQVIALCGEMDLANAGTAERELEDVLAAEAIEVVVDMGELEFIDSTGIALLVAILNRNGEGRVRFVPSRSPAVHRVLQVTGIEDRLPLVEAALEGGAASSPSL